LVTAANEAARATRGLAHGGAAAVPPSVAWTPLPAGTDAAGASGSAPATGPGHDGPAGAPELTESIDQLQALAAGMRELTR
jgi:hypothetical protein